MTNAFLRGGAEPAGTYDQFKDADQGREHDARRGLKAQPGDAEALAAVNGALSQYTAAVASARVNNRFGLPDRQRLPAAGVEPAADADGGSAGHAPDAAVRRRGGRRPRRGRLRRRPAAVIELAIAALVVLGGLPGCRSGWPAGSRRILNVPLTVGIGAVLRDDRARGA